MYMTLEYEPIGANESGAAVPVELGMKIHGVSGPEYARVTWDPVAPIRVDDDTCLVTAEVRINGTPGMAGFVMQGAKLLSADTENGPVNIRSVKFGEKAGAAGFLADGTPRIMAGAGRQAATIREYFDRNGLFVEGEGTFGGMHAVWFDQDVNPGTVDRFLQAHPWTPLGAFASTAKPKKNGGTEWALCYLYAHAEHCAGDMSRWRSDDLHAHGEPGHGR